MQTELVRAKLARDGGVPGQRAFKFGGITQIIDTLFKAADVPRRQADPADAHFLQSHGDENMLHQRGGLFGFVHRDFQLKRPGTGGIRKVAVHGGHMHQCAAIFHGCAQKFCFAYLQHEIFDEEGPAG